MNDSGFALFDTAIGACGIAWGPEGVTGLALPGPNAGRRFPGLDPAEPPPAIAAAAERIAAFLAGAEDDFADLPLDMAGIGDFERSVYRETRAIPAGATATYGTIAARLGDLGQARAVGQALGRNPWPIVIPCHRVTGADGRMGGFSAPGGRTTKLKLLEIEGALKAETLPLFGAAT